MNLTENTLKNLAASMPEHQTTIATTDPELLEIITNFAFGEVVDYSPLDVKLRMMVILGSTIASQALSEYKVMLDAALHVGITPIEIKEIVYQTIPYTGIAKGLDFLYATSEELENRGIEQPLASQSTTTTEDRQEKGKAIQKQIFGDVIDTMYEKSPENQLHIQKLLSASCFGDYYTRTGLDLKTRELLTFAILISLGGLEAQVKSHVQGNLNLGNVKQLLLDVTTNLLPYIGYPKTLNALKSINEVIPE